MGDRFGNIHGPVQTGDGVQYNAGRDQYTAHGDQHIAGRDQTVQDKMSREVLTELASLRQALEELRLTSAERTNAERELTAMENALRRGKPDVTATGTHLQTFAAGLKEAGALASEGASLGESIGKIARLLGPLGAGVLALL